MTAPRALILCASLLATDMLAPAPALPQESPAAEGRMVAASAEHIQHLVALIDLTLADLAKTLRQLEQEAALAPNPEATHRIERLRRLKAELDTRRAEAQALFERARAKTTDE